MEPARDAVVRSFARAVARPCARPGCPAPATATLTFRYTSREAWIGSLSHERLPETYDLCGAHADRTRPPHGWQLMDRRPADPDDIGPEGFGGEKTVALLAAALRDGPRAIEPPPALGTDELEPAPAAEPDEVASSPSADAPADDDLTAVLSALVQELDARAEVEGPTDGGADDLADDVILLGEALAAFRAEEHVDRAGSDEPAPPQGRLPFDLPGRAEDW